MREGDTYESGFTLSEDLDTLSILAPLTAPPVEKCSISEYYFILFDVETTSLADNNGIEQLSAVNTDSYYNSYVLPRNRISARLSNVTGLSLVSGKLLLRGKVMQEVTLHCHCLEFFFRWLKSPGTNPVILYGHNVRLDAKALSRSCQETGSEKTLPET